MPGVVVLALSGCAGRMPAPTPAIAPENQAPVELRETPFHAQQDYQCGPAALATALETVDVDVAPATLTPQLFIPERRGALQAELVGTVRRHGRLPYIIAPSLDNLVAQLHAGHPVVILQDLGVTGIPAWHYAVVIGYLPERARLVLRSGTQRRKLVPVSRFLRQWRKGDSWGMVVLRPDRLPAGADPKRFLEQAAALESLGNTQAAADAFKAAVSEWPDNPSAWIGAGNTQYALGQSENAEQAFRRALQLDPGNAAARNNLAQLLAERQCYEQARAQLRLALDTHASTPAVRKALLQTQQEINAADASSSGSGRCRSRR